MSFLQLRSQQTNFSTAKRYSSGKYAVDPNNPNDLTNLFSSTNYTDVFEADGVTVSQTGDDTNTLSMFMFKVKAVQADERINPVEIGWLGQSTVAGSTATITLQEYNFLTGAWVTLATDSTTA